VGRNVFTLSILLVCFVPIWRASTLSPSTDTAPPATIPVEQWLNGSDREDFPWKVRIARQSLTFQQRHLVQVLVTIKASALLRNVTTRDLHFVIKVADTHGTWLNGQSYSHFVPTLDFAGNDLLQPTANLYLKPGNYTIAVLAYDTLHNAGNLWRSKLVVPSVNSPLGDLDRDFPVVEFLPAFEMPHELKTSTPWALNHPAELAPLMLDPLSLGHGKAHLPIANKYPVRIDVIVNLSPGSQPYLPYKYEEGLVLQIGNLLSQLEPQRGCVRFTALDTLRQSVIVDRIDSHQLDWDAISNRIASVDLNVIDVRALKEKETALWLKRSIERVTADPATCSTRDSAARHVVIVVSAPFTFPLHAVVKPIDSALPPPRCYHLQLRFKSENWDQIGTILKPLNPTHLAVADGLAVRQKLAFLIADLADSAE